MLRIRKRLVLLGSVFVLVIVASVAAIAFLFPSEWIRLEAERRGTKAMKMPVSIGAVKLSFFPLGVRIDAIRLGGEAAPGKPSIRVGQVRVGVKMLPLIHKQIRISEIAIEKPEIVMVESREEKPRQTASKSAAGSETTTPQGFDFVCDRLSINNGSLTMLTAEKKPSLEIRGISETLRATAKGDGVISLEGILEVAAIRVVLPAGDLGRGLSLRLDKKLTYRLAEDRLSVERGDLRLGDLPVSVSGTAEGLGGNDRRVDIAFNGGPANITTILALIPDKMIPEMKGMTSAGVLSVEGRVKGALGEGLPADSRVRLILKDGRVSHPKFPSPVQGIAIDIDATPKALRLGAFRARVGKSHVDVRGTVSDPMKTSIVDLAIEASADLTEVMALQGDARGRKAGGTMAVNIRGKGPGKAPEKMDWSGNLSMTNITFSDPSAGFPPITGLNGRLSVNQQSARLVSTRGNIGKSDFLLNGRLDNLPLLYAENPKDKVLGFDVALESRLLDLDELGVGKNEKKKEGPLPDLTMLENIEGRAKLTIAKARFNGMDMQDVRGIATLENAVFTLSTFSLKAFGGALTLAGTMDYRNTKAPKFDLDLAIQKVKAPNLFGYATGLNTFGGIGPYLRGDLSVNAKFSGELTETMGLALEKLKSAGNVKVEKASLTGYPIQNSIAGMLNAPQLKSVTLESWMQPFEIAGGRLSVKGLKIRAKDFALTASGTQSVDGKLNMGVDLDLPPKLARGIQSEVPAHLRSVLFDGGDARLTVPLRLGGSLASPKVGVDSAKLTASAQQRMKAKLKKQGEEKVDSIRSNIEKLF